MKKFLGSLGFVVLVSLVLSFSLAGIAKAENGGTSGGTTGTTTTSGKPGVPRPLLNNLKDKRQELRDELKTERQAFITKLQADRATFVNELKTEKDKFKTEKSELKIAFCQTAKDVVGKRFDFVITQLEQYQSKVGDIIAKMTADGKDMSTASDSLTLSKQKLADAQAKLAAVKALVPNTCTSVSSDTFANIKLGVRDAKDLLKESRDALRQAVKAIRIANGMKDIGSQSSENGSDSSNKEDTNTVTPPPTQ